MELIIYGAQSIAIGAYHVIQNLYPFRKISYFLVTNQENNPKQLMGIPVLELKVFADNFSQEEKDTMEILIATPENVMPDIERLLEEQGLYCHVRLTSSRYKELMGYYYIGVENKKFIPLSALPLGFHKANVHMYLAKFYKDKPLSKKYDKKEWIKPIQVGAFLCKERIAEILDCTGEHISEKNENYSELTGLYWIWKNKLIQKFVDNSMEYYGLSHYRRILDLSEDDILRLVDNEVDVVLPYPMVYEPNIEEHHKRYLKEKDWKAVLTALEELQPNYTNAFCEILQQKYFYNYNIILARKEILKDYCNWLFPILERVEELSSPKGCERKDRYIGYIGESLETLYFMVNRDRLNITHSGCEFLF